MGMGRAGLRKVTFLGFFVHVVIGMARNRSMCLVCSVVDLWFMLLMGVLCSAKAGERLRDRLLDWVRLVTGLVRDVTSEGVFLGRSGERFLSCHGGRRLVGRPLFVWLGRGVVPGPWSSADSEVDCPAG